MKNNEIKTDDKSFRTFLEAQCNNSIVEHVAANMLPDILEEIILKNEYLHADCYELITGVKFQDHYKSLSNELRQLLLKSDETTIRGLMEYTFSKVLMIKTLIEYSDEYARLDIIENQIRWNKGEN